MNFTGLSTPFKVYNYCGQGRTLDGVMPNGKTYIIEHLGTIEYMGRRFVIYSVDGHKYIEEAISTKTTDLITIDDESRITYIEDEKLWHTLWQVALKEGILKEESVKPIGKN